MKEKNVSVAKVNMEENGLEWDPRDRQGETRQKVCSLKTAM